MDYCGFVLHSRRKVCYGFTRCKERKRSGDNADVAQLVEHHLAKVRVAGSSPVIRSGRGTRAARTVGWPRGEATACKAVYTGSNPVPTSLGRLAQRERASLTRKRSLVRSQYRPPAGPGTTRFRALISHRQRRTIPQPRSGAASRPVAAQHLMRNKSCTLRVARNLRAV